MKKSMRKFASLLLALVMVLSVVPQISLFDVVANASEALTSPVVDGKKATFYYENETASAVYVAGNFNGWNNTATALTKNEATNVWSCEVDNLGYGAYEYKFVVDGEWIADPANAVTNNGNSVFVIEAPYSNLDINGTTVTFKCDYPEATKVVVAGSIPGSEWSADSTEFTMTKNSDGLWELTKTVAPGKYQYKFVVDGSWKADPLNLNQEGGNSVFVVAGLVPTTDTIRKNAEKELPAKLGLYNAEGNLENVDVVWTYEGTDENVSLADGKITIAQEYMEDTINLKATAGEVSVVCEFEVVGKTYGAIIYSYVGKNVKDPGDYHVWLAEGNQVKDVEKVAVEDIYGDIWYVYELTGFKADKVNMIRRHVTGDWKGQDANVDGVMLKDEEAIGGLPVYFVVKNNGKALTYLPTITYGLQYSFDYENLTCEVKNVCNEYPQFAYTVAETETVIKKTVAPTYLKTGTDTYTATFEDAKYNKTEVVTIPKLAQKDLSKAVVTGVVDKVYTGSALTQSKMVIKVDGKTLKVGTDCKVTYTNNKAVGKATIKITPVKADSLYKGSKSVTFNIAPKAPTGLTVSTPKKGTLKVVWKVVSGSTAYRVQYSTKSNFSGAKTVTVSGEKTLNKTISSLKAGTYYVRISSVKKVSGTSYYSAWTAAKKIAIK